VVVVDGDGRVLGGDGERHHGRGPRACATSLGVRRGEENAVVAKGRDDDGGDRPSCKGTLARLV
jgi:hypothetical protein